VESIGSFAFSYCTLIKSLVMGNGINIINDHIFYYGNLEKIYYYGTASDWGKIAIHEIAFDPNPTIYYYSETTPTDTGNYWHYVNESPTAW